MRAGGRPCAAKPLGAPPDQIRRRAAREDQRKSIVHSSKLIGIKAPGGIAEALRIDHRGLLYEDSGCGPVE